jgi:hypothetical protein
MAMTPLIQPGGKDQKNFSLYHKADWNVGFRGLTCVISEEDTAEGGKGANEVGLEGDGSFDASHVGRALNNDTTSHLVSAKFSLRMVLGKRVQWKPGPLSDFSQERAEEDVQKEKAKKELRRKNKGRTSSFKLTAAASDT